MQPKNKDEFAEYCLRKLGAPVIQINVDDDQIDDRIDEALQFYQKYHYDAIEHLAITYEITQNDIDNKYITMPIDIVSVVELAYDGTGIIKGGFGNNLWHSMHSISQDINFGNGACRQGTQYYTAMMDYMAHLKFTFKINHKIEFQYRNHFLYIDTNWSKFSVDEVLVFDVYRLIDPDVHGDIWSDIHLQEYCTALIGEQWGNILSKYADVPLACGITIDGDKIYDRYHEEKLRIEEDFSLKHEEPIDFFCG